MTNSIILMIEAAVIIILIPLISKLINNGIKKREAKRDVVLARLEDNSRNIAQTIGELKAMSDDNANQHSIMREHLAVTRKNVLKLVIMDDRHNIYDRLEAFHEYIKNGWNHEVEEVGRKLILENKDVWKEVLEDKGIHKSYEEQLDWINTHIFTGG